jgi:cytochrome c oxidase cbb3-type subunit 3
MSDFVSEFWSSYIAVITVLSIVFCLFLLFVNSKKPPKTADNTTGHVWDGDLREANNPLPRWWSGLFVITILFAAVYLWLYPGLGAHAGAAKWSAHGQYDAEKSALDAEMTPLYAGFLKQPVTALIGDPQAKAIGERLFLANCAQCHGSDARGAKGFPNLTDADWLYGNAPEQIIQTLAKGRNGIMPPMGAAVGGAAEVEQLAQYVLSLSGGSSDPVKAELGKPRFAVCAACHGPDGKGNQAIGAPNLTDKIWVHGGGLQQVIAMINNGKNNLMPAWEDKLTEGQIHVLASYVLGLSQTPPKQAAR